MVSQEFKNALKIYPKPKSTLAWEAGITPNVLNHLINEHMRVKMNDPRLIKIAKLIGFPKDKIFDGIKMGGL